MFWGPYRPPSHRNVPSTFLRALLKQFALTNQQRFNIDESTTLSRKTTLIIYIRVAFNDALHTIFLDLLELSQTDASTIYEELIKCLRSYGFDDAYLSENLIAFATDGASVMLGRRSGVAIRIREKFPRVITWHCIAHRLELAVNDSVEEVTGVNNFRIFMDKLYIHSITNLRKIKGSCMKSLNHWGPSFSR